MEKIQVTCGKCSGTGNLTEYKHIAGGICFACNGVGYFERTLKQIEAKNKRKQQNAEQKLNETNEHRKESAERLYTFIEAVKDNQVFINLMSQCLNNTYYEQHAINAMKCMIGRGLYNG